MDLDELSDLLGEPVFYAPDGTPCSRDEWAGYRSDPKVCVVGRTQVAGDEVSTVYLGIDHGYSLDGRHRPVIYETLVFYSGGSTGLMRRYRDRAEAEIGHAETVDLLGAARDAVDSVFPRKPES
jgi:hypothetical protein